MYCLFSRDNAKYMYQNQKSESETDLLPRRILHQQGICLDEEGAYIEDNKQWL